MKRAGELHVEKLEIPVDKARCSICSKPAKAGEPILSKPEAGTFIHGRCYDTKFEPKKK
jgi:hypothetical protein